MSDATSKTYEVKQVESVLTIESGIPSFSEGYKVWIEPFTLTEDRDDIEVLILSVILIGILLFVVFAAVIEEMLLGARNALSRSMR